MIQDKKLKSYKYRFLISAQRIHPPTNDAGIEWDDFLRSLDFTCEEGQVSIAWTVGNGGKIQSGIEDAVFYLRGDTDRQAEKQRKSGMQSGEDPIRKGNAELFGKLVSEVAEAAGFKTGGMCEDSDKFAREREFHDEWAGSTNVEEIDVFRTNEACTAPEMRYITKRLGNLKGKKLLDVGCGLGEASVYFAIRGAQVTSSDLSPGMLDATCRLAQANGVSVTPHVSAAEDLRLPADALFDVIYAGNLLHHVDIEATIKRFLPHLKPGGKVVTWDPLAYNPAINVYRKKAMEVRTVDEHPLTWNDIRLFREHFRNVETRYFWLTTLAIFVAMALLQRRDPNKERYWKSVIDESDKWAPMYKPLEFFDRILLTILPPLRLLCWNVVIVAEK
ncbi:class I SAM-dependent methyltransferase [Pseudodesulfovibrio tunisiensis]|uniref:class I SAM-dependent methyltransferase n=1 Tax=Pseudodesulfovibrio tunisiensis TaxID=463192 RepID=UPI001FB3E2B7|nr:class I SAM-dependent methyltransferase [Pseudodesulfovibrio tunisiensis]